MFSGGRIVCALVVAREVTPRRLREWTERILHHLYRSALTATNPEGSPLIRTSRVVLTDQFVERNPGSRVGPHLLVSVSDPGGRLTSDTLGQVCAPSAGRPPDLESPAPDDAATVYALVTRAGGHIDVESTPDGGTMFHIYLPEAA